MESYAKIISLLKQDPRFVSDENELLKNIILEAALKFDIELIKLLLADEYSKKLFFISVGEALVFDKDKFIRYISNKEFLPDSYTSFKNKIGLVDASGEFITNSGEVVLAWPYKDCVLEGGQTADDQKRSEIFWNQNLALEEIDRLLDPKVLTNFKKYDVDGEHSVDQIQFINENLVIKGNNLLALHSVKKVFAGQVRLIYIDPPYNTGNDSFGYNDSFNHSTWLTFMKNRLEVAKELLSKDGSIWINIGDEEAHYLKVLCDGVFQRENFVRNIVWQKRTSPDMRATIGDGHDHILVYAKNLDVFKEAANNLNKTEEQRAKFKNPDNDPKGPWVSSDFTAQGYRPNQMYKIVTPGGTEYVPPASRCWKNIESVYLDLVAQGRMWFGTDGNGVPRRKTYLRDIEKNAVWSWWTNKEVGHNQEAKKEVIALFGPDDPFATPKPERLLERIIRIATDEGDLVLDFFAGSGTAAAVALKLKRQFIAIEQMEYIEKYTVTRLKKVIGSKRKSEGELVEVLEFDHGGVSKAVNWQGGGSFIYLDLMEWNEAIGKKISAAKSKEELIAYWNTIQEKGALNYRFNQKTFETAASDFNNLSLEDQKMVLLEILDKNQLYVNLTEIDDTDFQVSDSDKKLNQEFYSQGNHA